MHALDMYGMKMEPEIRADTYCAVQDVGDQKWANKDADNASTVAVAAPAASQ